jgi:hypothetical protein
MLLTGKQISEIESMAELFFDIADIAVNIEVNAMHLRNEINSVKGFAFMGLKAKHTMLLKSNLFCKYRNIIDFFALYLQ